MGFYSTFTLKEWLALHCCTEDVDNLFCKALKDNDTPMAVLALFELVKRCEVDLVKKEVDEAIDAGYFAICWHFSDEFAKALTYLGSCHPALKTIASEVRAAAGWPKAPKEPFDF